MGAEASNVIGLIQSGTDQYFVWVVVIMIGMLIWEIIATFRLQSGKNVVEKIEKKMETEGVSEKEAEKEVEEEKKTKKKDKKVFNLEVKEFTILRKLLEQVNKAANSDPRFLDNAKKTLSNLKKEETLEKRLDKRIKALETEAKRLAAEEPKHKAKIEELLLEIDKNHKQLVASMSEGGEFEKVLTTRVSASMTKEQKKNRLIAILDAAIKFDLGIIEASKQLGTLTK